MKIFFVKEDSLYKIIKSLEKLPKGKKIFLHIDHENSFFDNAWWGKQVMGVLQEKGIPYVCLSHHPKTKKYFQDIGMPHEYKAPNRFLHGLHMIGLFLFNVKKFHLSVFTKKSSLSYLFIVGEIIGIAAILYIMYQFLVPSTSIIIQPAYTVEDVVYNYRYYPHENSDVDTTGHKEYIGVPYEFGTLSYTKTLSVPMSSLQYLSRPSLGNLVVYNTLPTKFTLRVGTKFTTVGGEVFLANDGFVLPPGRRDLPSMTVVAVSAADIDLEGKVIGERGNITTGERLVIKNLNQSSILGAIYANPQDRFTGGFTKKGGTVSTEDITILQNKLLSQISGDNIRNIIKKEFKNEDGFLLPLPELMSISQTKFTVNAGSGDTVENLEATIQVQYQYPYVIWNNLMDGVSHYVSQRPSQTRQLISLQKNTATFYDTYMINDIIVVPTKVAAVWGYDFSKDTNHLKEEMKNKIAGLSVEEAKKVILSYPEISSVVIKASPVWSDTLPTVKSRIFFRTTSE